MKKPIIRRNFRKIQKRLTEIIAEDNSPIQIEILNSQEKERYLTNKLESERVAMEARNTVLYHLDSSKLYSVRVKGINGTSVDIINTLRHCSVEKIKDLLRAIDNGTPVTGRTSDNEIAYYRGGLINRCFIDMS